MQTLRKFLSQKGYSRVKLKKTKTNHLEMRAKINEIEGNFLLDTGASSSCVSFENTEYFELFAEDSDIKAAGAGRTNMLTRVSSKNSLQIGEWSRMSIEIVLFDLRHVNEALESQDAKPVRGIIGADILKKGKAIIDYKNCWLYLK